MPARFLSRSLLWMFCTWLLPAVASSDDGANGPADVRRLTILHTNDLHGHLQRWRGWEGDLAGREVGGLARLATAIQDARRGAGADHVLLLDAGDTWADTLIARETQGRAVLAVMNTLGYDAMVPGNHEPDFGAETLAQRIREARFPVLAANLERDTGQDFAPPTLMLERAGVKVGILGLTYPKTPLTTNPKNVEGLRYLDPVATARTLVPRLRAQGAELVIALTHLGLAADRKLAESVPGIDVIVGGHSHNRMRTALKVGDTLIVQAGAHGSDLGRLDLEITNGRVLAHRRRLIPITDQAEDSATAREVARQLMPYRADMDATAGRVGEPLVRAQTIAGQEAAKRDAESPVDSLFADILRETIGVDVALLPGVGYGVAIPAGGIDAGELRNLIPHDSKVYTLRLKGAELREVLEQAVENVFTKDTTQKVGGMIQVSGLRFAYDPARSRGQRVREVTVGDAPLDEARVYTAVVNGLLAQGGHHYRTLAAITERRERGDQYAMVEAWLKGRTTVTPPAGGRITRLGGGPSS